MTVRGLIAPKLAGLLVLLIVVSVAGMRLVDGPSAAVGPQVLLRDAKGALAIDQSRAGRALVRGRNLRPGQAVRGHAVVENAGDAPARITLSSRHLAGVAGPNGGSLAEVLMLRVRKRTLHNSRRGPRTLYEGALGEMPPLDLGTWGPGGVHEYTFRVELPDTGRPSTATSGDNAYQGSSAEVGFVWTGHAI